MTRVATAIVSRRAPRSGSKPTLTGRAAVLIRGSAREVIAGGAARGNLSSSSEYGAALVRRSAHRVKR